MDNRAEMVDQVRKLGKGVEIVEDLRNQSSANNLFASIFNGIPSFDIVSKWPKQSAEEVRKKNKLVDDLTKFLIDKVDPFLVDSLESVPLEIFQQMADLGFYGIKTPEKYGGHGLSQTSYAEALGVAASWCSAVVIVLSADNTIGCKFPVMYYGTDEQKDRLLPELIKWPTGFCLTEKDAGSDASKIKTYAKRIRDNQFRLIGYEITGQKWYTTNGILKDHVSLAKYLAVVARVVNDPSEVETEKDSRKFCFGLFIVPTSSDGLDIGTRNTFIGMRGIHNSNPIFNRVFIPVANLVGEKRPDWESERGWNEREGSGFKIAMESLNTGRIAIAKGCIGVSKQAHNITNWWSGRRDQFGGPLSDKELVRDKLIYSATNILAMEAMAKYACLAFDSGQDVRVEAAAVKTFASERTWQIVDNMAQTRGGRFYEIWQSLSKRELTPPDEIIWTATRPNRIFEGSNEIMVQFEFREGADRYIKAGATLMSKRSSALEKLEALIKMSGYYVGTFVPRSISRVDARLSPHLKFVDLSSRNLARKVISKSSLYSIKQVADMFKNKLHKKQATKYDKYRNDLAQRQLMLDRFARINIGLGAMVLTCAYARELDNENSGNHNFIQLADLFCRATQTEVEILFKALDNNDDEYRYRVSERLLAGDFNGLLLDGIIPMTEEFMRGPNKD